MPGVMFGDATGQEMLIILPDRVGLSVERRHRCRLVDSFERTTETRFATSIAATTAEFFVSDQATVREILSSGAEAPGIDDDGEDLDNPDGAKTLDR